jgi:hypothetical protein
MDWLRCRYSLCFFELLSRVAGIDKDGIVAGASTSQKLLSLQDSPSRKRLATKQAPNPCITPYFRFKKIINPTSLKEFFVFHSCVFVITCESKRLVETN